MKRLLSCAFALLFVAAVLMPVIAVNAVTSSFNYSFTMEHRYVNGWDNGQVYSLPAGTATISGSVYAYPIDAASTENPYPVSYTLCSKVFLGIFTKEWGTVKGPAEGTVSGSFGKIDAGDKYYLTVWTVEEDHWYHSGHGKVTVKY
ncbi:MAG: hypothetical protein J1E60_03310 [Christensenellaceae bacterium]|nr:hypothetical protein [Christensenellaceae bacterium]